MWQRNEGTYEEIDMDHHHEDTPPEGVVMEIEDAMNVVGFGRVQLKMVSVVGLLLSADAMEMMILSFLGPSVRCSWGISHEEEALLTTVVFLGMLIGAYSCGVLADKYGRRKALKVISMLSFVFGVLSALVPSFELLLVVRAFMGVTLGGLSIAFAYVMEFLPTSHRGKWGILLELFWSLGTFVECMLAWLVFGTATSEGSWRILVLVSAFPVFLGASAFLLNVVPESPRYLSASGRPEEAYTILRDMARENGKELPENGALKVVHCDEKRDVLNVFQVLKAVFSPAFRRLTLFLWFIWFTNSFSYYGIVLLTTSLAVQTESNGTNPDGDDLVCDPVTKSPFEGSETFIQVMIATASELPGTLLAVFSVDTLGRKFSQCISFLGAFVALVVLFYLPPSEFGDTGCLFFARAFVMSSFVISYVYTPEVYPTSLRTTAFGLSISFSRFGGMISPFVGEDLVERGERQKAIFLFILFVGCAAVASLLLPVETKGASLKDTTEECSDSHDSHVRPSLGDSKRSSSSSSSSSSSAFTELELSHI